MNGMRVCMQVPASIHVLHLIAGGLRSQQRRVSPSVQCTSQQTAWFKILCTVVASRTITYELAFVVIASTRTKYCTAVEDRENIICLAFQNKGCFQFQKCSEVVGSIIHLYQNKH